MSSRVVMILAYLLACATVAGAQSIHIEWGYTPPSEPEVSGFKLYQEGVFVCETDVLSTTSMDCEVTLSAATTTFTLTAAFVDGTESPHSAPFAFAPGSGGKDDESPIKDAPYIKFGKIGPSGHRNGWVGMQ